MIEFAILLGGGLVGVAGPLVVFLVARGRGW